MLDKDLNGIQYKQNIGTFFDFFLLYLFYIFSEENIFEWVIFWWLKTDDDAL